jgi:hypothetical protein
VRYAVPAPKHQYLLLYDLHWSSDIWRLVLHRLQTYRLSKRFIFVITTEELPANTLYSVLTPPLADRKRIIFIELFANQYWTQVY